MKQQHIDYSVETQNSYAHREKRVTTAHQGTETVPKDFKVTGYDSQYEHRQCGQFGKLQGSDESDQAEPKASVPDESTAEEVGPRKRNEALKSWQGSIALTPKH